MLSNFIKMVDNNKENLNAYEKYSKKSNYDNYYNNNNILENIISGSKFKKLEFFDELHKKTGIEIEDLPIKKDLSSLMSPKSENADTRFSFDKLRSMKNEEKESNITNEKDKKKFNPLKNYRPQQQFNNNNENKNEQKEEINNIQKLSESSKLINYSNTNPNENESEEILKNFESELTNNNLELSEEIYLKFRSKFKILLTSQIGSRVLQKSISFTKPNILNMISNEVSFLFRL